MTIKAFRIRVAPCRNLIKAGASEKVAMLMTGHQTRSNVRPLRRRLAAWTFRQ
jgi:hypothetical protein